MRSTSNARRRQLTLHESIGRASKQPFLDLAVSEDSSSNMTSNASSIFSNPHFIWQNLGAHSPRSNSKTVTGATHSVTNLHEMGEIVEFPPTSYEYTDAWNASYVKLPCSPQNLYYENGKSVCRWSLIERALSAPITSVEEFANAVLSYNARFVDSWNFDHLSAALQIEPRYLQLLPKIAGLALKLPHLITRPIPLLLRNQEASVSLNQSQIACLLANAFYCTFPHRNTRSKKSEYSNFPFINFGVLMSGGYRNQSGSTDQKVLCILHYFSRIFSVDPPGGIVTYTRRCLNQPPDFVSSDAKFKSIAFGVSSTCLIEDADPGTVQVNFANRFLGGGVLHGGCVQEEILCCIRPEILAGLLFIEAMDNHEAIVIEGAERFSSYTGYGPTFKWSGDFNEAVDGKNMRNEDGRWMGAIIAIDALPFTRGTSQFEGRYIRRELNKAYCGFTNLLAPHRALPDVVVSGHWGCGAFNGDRELKCLIQMTACAQAGKSLAYCSLFQLMYSWANVASIIHHWSVKMYISTKCLWSRNRRIVKNNFIALIVFKIGVLGPEFISFFINKQLRAANQDAKKEFQKALWGHCINRVKLTGARVLQIRMYSFALLLPNGVYAAVLNRSNCSFEGRAGGTLYLTASVHPLQCRVNYIRARLMAFVLRPVPNFMLISHACCFIIRHVSIKSWPTLDNPWRERLNVGEQATFPSKYVVSKEEFKFVEMLKPVDTIPPPPPTTDATPSGWVPPRPEICSKKPYTVTRSRNHMLPVYLAVKERKRREQTHGKRMLTVITKVGGDISALATELEALLKGKCETGRLLCQVDEVTQKITIDGTTRACIIVMNEYRERFLRKFREMDIDNSGILSKSEVKECLSAAGFDKKFIKKFMKRFDADGDGNITEDEYLRVVCDLPEEELKIAFWRSVFDDVDRDKSGRISCVELHNLLGDMGFPVKVSELEEWIRIHDKDKDGEMDFHEFVAFMSDTTH
ncbi:Poly ADP-ribose glycohydrolase [Taenia crassiceps]|uniref:poly(ADP-ribose) glycohydrolase n=1 Tax=Taenia crassiceps TaxID=6207 RepID=A0ABR4QE99_9CEST